MLNLLEEFVKEKDLDWLVTLYQISPGNIAYNQLTPQDWTAEDHLKLLETTCSVILGRLRDEHPNFKVADAAVHLLLLLNHFTRMKNRSRNITEI